MTDIDYIQALLERGALGASNRVAEGSLSTFKSP
jgi:hypothetical protein